MIIPRYFGQSGDGFFSHQLGFMVKGRLIANGAMQPLPVVEDFDVFEDDRSGLLLGLEGFFDVQLVLERGPERFPGGIVAAIALGARFPSAPAPDS